MSSQQSQDSNTTGCTGLDFPGSVAQTPHSGCHARNGDAFIIIGLPRETEFGCDTMAMTVPTSVEPSAMCGLRGLPPGAHFVWVSACGALSRQGYWFVSSPNADKVRVKQWDRYDETLVHHEGQYGDLADLAHALDRPSLDSRLLPYGDLPRQDGPPSEARPRHPRPDSVQSCMSDIWPRLTSGITQRLLHRVAAVNSSKHADSEELAVSTIDAAKGEMGLAGPSHPEDTAALVFLFPSCGIDPYQRLASKAQNPVSAGATDDSTDSTENTEAARRDVTKAITDVLDSPTAQITEADVVGELQFTFLTGTLISNLSCLEQWWHLVLDVFLRAYRLPICRPRLCSLWIQALHAQFMYLERHVSGGFLGSSMSATQGGDNDGSAGIFDVKPWGAARLQEALAVYKHSLGGILRDLGDAATPEQTAVSLALSQLEAWLWKYGWDLRIEEDGRHRGQASSSQQPTAWPAMFSDDSDDEGYQPVLVEIDEQGREVGLVSWDSDSFP